MKNKKTKSVKQDKDFSLETVKKLGGNEDDFELLKDINMDREISNSKPGKQDDSNFSSVEVQDFISKLGFGNFSSNKNSSLADADDEESDDDQMKTNKKGKNKKVTLPKEKKGKKVTSEIKTVPKQSPAETRTKPKSGKQNEVRSVVTTSSKPKSSKKFKNKFEIQNNEVSSSTISPEEEIRRHIASYTPRKFLIVKPDDSINDENANLENSTNVLPTDIVREMQNFAAKLMEDEAKTYKTKKDAVKSSEAKWIQTVLRTGTLSDRMAALTLLIQESPVHNLESLENLVSMARKKGKRECMLATETLCELFLTEILPSNRKLKKFNQNPLSSVAKDMRGHKELTDKKLILWYYESQLKEIYSLFIKALDEISKDTVIASKQKAVICMFKLLTSKPEQEHILLPLLVNKVGDPDYKLASRASHYLSKLVENHSNMTMVVIKEVERLLYRPNIASKAQYYSMCFLSQIVLHNDDKDVAMKLIDIYFSFFTVYVNKGEVENKMMSILLTGVNRAYPYANIDQSYISKQMNNLHKVVHLVNFNTSVQALMLLYQIMDSSEGVSDRFYTALYRKISDPALKTSSKQTIFLNLLYKAIRTDFATKRIKAFLKRLLQVCSYHIAPFVCGALILVSEIIHEKAGVLNLSCNFDDSDDEHFEDLPEPEEFRTTRYHSDSEAALSEGEVDLGDKESSWDHRKNLNGHSESGMYDPFHRNPLYCRADRECFWELIKLTKHFHPSVALFAQNIIQGAKISYSGDPLQDFTLIRFLERFVYKNPKKLDASKGDKDVKKPKSRFSLKTSLPTGIKKLRVNEAEYLAGDESKIPEDEKFFYRYFRQKAELGQDGKKREKGVEDVSDDEFETFLDDFEKNIDPHDITLEHDLDFAGEFARTSSQKKKKKKDGDNSSSDEDDEDLSDEEPEFDNDEMKEAFKEYDIGIDGVDEENIAFSDEDGGTEISSKPSKKELKRRSKVEDDLDMEYGGSKKKKNKSNNLKELYAAAEGFSTLIDSNMDDDDLETLGSQALSNKDHSDVKQLRWENAREKWINDKDWKSRKRMMKAKGPPKKSFGSKGKNNVNPGGKNTRRK